MGRHRKYDYDSMCPKIAELRSKGLSYEKIAKELGVSESTIARVRRYCREKEKMQKIIEKVVGMPPPQEVIQKIDEVAEKTNRIVERIEGIQKAVSEREFVQSLMRIVRASLDAIERYLYECR